MKDSGYNQVLVMIDHLTKYAEAVPCITASAEETCDHLINTWIARHGYPMTFQSDNGTAFVGELTKELMRRSQVAQAHSTTYHPQTNGLVERQNRTLVSMLRVYCSRYMTDWDRYLPQVMGAYNSTQHSTNGVSPHMMLTGHEKIELKKIGEEVVGLEEITVSHDIDIVDDHDDEWVDDRSKPEVEFDDEQQQSYEQDLTNLRVLEWLN